MNIVAFLATLRSRDIEVWVERDQLRCSAPPGALNSALRNELRLRKPDILKFLETAAQLSRQQRALIPLQPGGTRPPVFAVAGHNGDVFCYRTLVRHLGDDQPFFGLQPPGLDGHSLPLRRVEDLAAYFAAQIKAFQPKAPYTIAGYCAGGAIAFELARQLLRDGEKVSVLALFGAPYASAYRLRCRFRLRLFAEAARVARHLRAVSVLAGAERRSYMFEKISLMLKPPYGLLRFSPWRRGAHRLRDNTDTLGIATSKTENQSPQISSEVLAQRIRVQRATFAALRHYVPGHFAGRIILLLPCKAWVHSGLNPLRWRSVGDHVEQHFGPDDCHTDAMLLEPYAPIFARLFNGLCATS